MRGRKPKPRSRQVAEGDPRKHGAKKLEQALAAEPKAASGLPACPRHLKGRARYAWQFWSEELRAMKLDKRPDAQMLEGACRAYERAVKADLLLDTEGWTIEERTVTVSEKPGGTKVKTMSVKRRPHYALAVSHKAWTLVRSFCSEFGLSPVSRTRLTIEKSDDGDDDLMKLLSQPREPQQPSVN